MSKKTYMKLYRQSPIGILRSIYADQVNHSKARGHPLPEYSSDSFLEWGLNSKKFRKLYFKWVKSGFQTDLRPSPDRLDDYNHYMFSNLRWVTFRENVEHRIEAQLTGVNTKQNKAVLQLDLNDCLITTHCGIKFAGRVTGVAYQNIFKCCSGSRKTAGGFKWKYVT